MGDAAGAVLGAAILLEANRQGVTRSTLARMAANIALDLVLGAVPVVGDLFDATWKANRRNLSLLERHQTEPVPAKRADRLFVIALGAGLLVLCGTVVVGGALLAASVLSRLG